MPYHIKLSGVSFSFRDGRELFKNINLSLSAGKTGLIGANGSGKSTLLNLISGKLLPSLGSVDVTGKVIHFEQDHSRFNNMEVAEVLGISTKLEAIKRILAGAGTEEDYLTIDNDWDIEEKSAGIIAAFGLSKIGFGRMFSSLSGGEAARLLLASCITQNASFILLDEPTNHLDYKAKEAFYGMIDKFNRGMLIVSHNKELLRKMDRIIELTPTGIKSYGGNYNFYLDRKEIEKAAFESKITDAEKKLKKQQRISDAVISSKVKHNRLAEKRRTDGGIIKAVLNKKRGQAEKTIAKLAETHNAKLQNCKDNLIQLKADSPLENTIKVDIDTKQDFRGRILVRAYNVNYKFDGQFLWTTPVNFEIKTGERVLISGKNGAGKTTLVNLILKNIFAPAGEIIANYNTSGYVDQNYTLIDSNLTLYENIKKFAPPDMPEHELRIRLARFLFFGDDVFKPANKLSGGEKSRLTLACLLAVSNTPELIALDEPTNNLDLASIEQMQNALKEYRGGLIVISHDIDFIESLGIERIINLDDYI